MHLKLKTGLLFLATCVFCANKAAKAQDAVNLLNHADQVADFESLAKAQPLYQKAFAAAYSKQDPKAEYRARLGQLRYSAQQGHYSATRTELFRMLSTPITESDPELRIRTLEILGNIDLNQNTQAALLDWTNVRDTARAINDEKSVNRANGYLGLVAALNGDIGAAGKALFRALATAQKLGDVRAVLTFGMWLANGMATNGMSENAVHVLDQVEAAARAGGYSQLPVSFTIAKIRALNASGTEIGRAKAEALLKAAIADPENQTIAGARTELLGQAGQIAIQEHSWSTAESNFSEQIQIAGEAKLPAMEADGLLRLSQCYRSQNKNRQAELAINRGIAAVRRVDETYDIPNYIAEKAEVELALGHTQTADRLYDQATSLIEGLLVNAPSSRVRSAMIGSMSDIYLGHFRLAWERLHDGPKAFRILESARGRAVLGSLATAEKTSNRRVDVAPEQQIVRLQNALLHSPMSTLEAKKILNKLDLAYSDAFATESENGRASALHVSPVKLDELRRKLQTGEVIIEYVLDVNSSHAVVITNRGLEIHRLPPRVEIDRLAKQFLGAVMKNGDFSDTAQMLFKDLISPFIDHSVKTLILVPDGSLHSLPFAALIDGDGHYLCQRFNIFSSPSASVYFKLANSSAGSQTTRSFLGVAYSPSQSAEMASASIRTALDLRGASLAPLPFAREEVTKAAAALGASATILDGEKATETSLKTQPLSTFRMIHFAVHAVGNDLEPDRAALVLNPGSIADDGLWQAREIRQTRLNADAIVLSACETGVGKLQGQEGVMNLARAFFSSGAKSVVASLWNVDDRATASVMESFYQHLATGVAVDEALRQAQVDFIKGFGSKAKPYLWAGFEVIGDGSRRIDFATNKAIAHSAN